MKLVTAIAVSAAVLTLGMVTQAGAKKHEEEVKASDVPAAVMKAAEKETKGMEILRWAKEGSNYEAVVSKDGKEWGFKFNSKGKYLGKHEETMEHKEGEKKS